MHRLTSCDRVQLTVLPRKAKVNPEKMIRVTWVEYLKSKRTLTEGQVSSLTEERDEDRGVIVPDDHHHAPQHYGAAAH